MQLAYSIAAHRNPSQLRRLLSAIYNPHDLFVLHIDARSPEVRSAAQAFAREAGDNVVLIENRRVIWGGWSQTRVQLAMMERALSYDNHPSNGSHRRWDYLINLSGQDYPLRTPEQIRRWLADQGPDRNFFEVLDFDQATAEIRPRMDFFHFELGNKLRRIRLRRPTPKGLHVFWGSSWFIASRSLCELATSSPLAAQCRKAIRLARSSDEIFFQTLLMNSPLREMLVRDPRRKIVWDGGSHPRTFTLEDAPELLSADAFFARKFDETVDAAILDVIDRELLGIRRQQPSTPRRTPMPSASAQPSAEALHHVDPDDMHFEPA